MLQRDPVTLAPEQPTHPQEPYPGLLAARDWRDITALHVSRTVDEVVLPPSQRHLVLVNVGRPFRMEEALDGRRYQTRGRPGDVAVVPAGMPVSFRTATRTPAEVETFAMLLEPSLLERISERSGVDAAALGLIGTVGGRDPAIERIASALALELRPDEPLDELYAESLTTALVAQLIRGHTSANPRAVAAVEAPAIGRLSTRQLRDVTDHIEATLDGDLSLSALAAITHMSAFHFSRLFRATTGTSPHQFVLLRKVERARRLLTTTTLPLTEVAHLAGFADQSHLARHTRRLYGLTPTALRRLAV